MSSNNYRVPGTKMTSRFGMSHKALRAADKYHAQFCDPAQRGKVRHVPMRLLKTCTHPKMIDESYGGPDGGCIDLTCAVCGQHWHTTLY